MSTSYEVVGYRPTHKSQVAELGAQLWEVDLARAVQYLEWKYEQNPYAPEPMIYAAFAGRELAGIRGFYGAQWESGVGSSRVVTSVPVADDLIVAPAHRNRTLVTLIMQVALADLARRGYRYVLNLTGSQVAVVGSLAMGWKSAGQLEPIVRQTDCRPRQIRELMSRTRLVWRFANSPLLLSGRERHPFRLLDAATRRIAGSIEIDREPRPDAMSALIDRLGHDGRIRHVRNREFFAWRCQHPISRYRFLYSGGAHLDGYLVLRASAPNRGGRGTVSLMDLAGSSAAVRTQLLETALEKGRFPELYTWAAALPNGTPADLMTRGFEPTELKKRAHGCPCVLVKALAPDPGAARWALGGQSLTDLSAWDLRMIDSMAG